MYSIAIDGPGGAGKSTIAKRIAKKMGCVYIDTGAMYRAVGLYAVEKNIDTHDEEKVCALLDKIEIDIKNIDGTMHIMLCGKDVSDKIRTPEISMAASNVAKFVLVRLKLVELQRQIASTGNVIMDGRDIGTYVLPGADVKIYLTAAAEARAKRRYDELIEKGQRVNLRDIIADINKRDYNDSHREFAPLKKAEDAVCVDTSDIGLEESVEKVFEIIINKLMQREK